MTEEIKIVVQDVQEQEKPKMPEYHCARCGALVGGGVIVCKTCASEGPVDAYR